MNTKTWKNRVLSVALAVIMVISMLPLPVVAAGSGSAADAVPEVTGSGSAADAVPEVTGSGNAADAVSDVTGGDAAANALTVMNGNNAEYAYIGADGKLTTQANCTEITAAIDDISWGWYVLKEDVTVSLLNISEEVNLILCDGATLTVSSYLNIAQNSTLNLYWQSAGSGKLTAAKIGMMGSVTAPAGEMKQTADASGTTFEKCLTHEWGYTKNTDNDTHTATCKLCGKAEAAESHSYDSWKADEGGTPHTGTCVCGATKTEGHSMSSLVPNDDGLTHSTKCSGCDYATAAEKHDFSSIDEFGDKKCACGVRLAAEYDGKNYATLASAIEAAKDGGAVTLQAATVTENITIEDGTNVTIDLNGKTWEGMGTTWSGYQPVPLTVSGGSVTVKNGTLDQGGASSNANTAVIVNGGSLTVGESMTIQGGKSDSKTVLPAITVESGSLTLTENTNLYGGMKVSVDGKTLADYLPEGTAYHQAPTDGTESVANGYVQELTGNFRLVVREHTHNLDADGECACGFDCPHGTYEHGICTVCGYVCKHPADKVTEDENGAYTCGVCSEQMAVKVESGSVTTYYAQTHYTHNGVDYDNTLQTILNDDTITPSGSTITLLADNLLAFAHVQRGKTITLDLNGKALIETGNGICTFNDDPNNKLIVTGTGTSEENKSAMYSRAFAVYGGTLKFDSGFGGEFNEVYVSGGTLTFTEGQSAEIHTLTIAGDVTITPLKSGKFGKIVTEGSVTSTASSLLEWGYAFQKADGSYVPYHTSITATSALEDVTVVQCDHGMTEMPTGNQYNKLKCPDCGKPLNAVLKTADGKINGYEELTSAYGKTTALSVAANTPGCTVTMYNSADNGLGIWSTAEGFTLDANDCTISQLTLNGGTLTVKNATITGSKLNGGYSVMTSYRSDRVAALTLEDCLVEKQEDGLEATLTANGPVTLKNTVVEGKTKVHSLEEQGLTVEESSRLVGDTEVSGNLTFKSGYAGKITVYGAAEISGGSITELDASDAGSLTTSDGDLTVSGGTFDKITAPDGKNLSGCLKEGYAFYNNGGDNSVVDGRTGTLEGVKVTEHTHGEYKWDTTSQELVCACGHVKATDKDLPTFSGIADGETYYQNTLTFTAEDTGSGLASVKDGGKALIRNASGEYTITANNAEHTITAIDNAGNTATVSVWVCRIYQVTFADGEGYTIEAAATVNHNTDYTFWVTIGEGYTATDTYAVKVNNESVTGTLVGGSTYRYTVTASKVNDDLTITVEGVADVTAPEAEIAIGTNTFKSFLNKITLGLFFKETQTVTVTASDKGSGVKTVEYLLSAQTFDRAEDITGDWKTAEYKDGKATFDIAPDGKGSVYVRVTDESGNAVAINSDGVVLYTDSTADTVRISFSRLAADDVSFKVNLNGNTVKGLSYSGGEIDSTQYVVDVNGTITLKNGWLKTLEAGEYTITVTYNPMGESYVEQAGNETPATTTVSLEVLRNTRTLDFAAPDAIYGGKAYDGLTITAAPAGTTIRYKVRDAADDTYSAAAPEDAGSYTVQISTPQDADYNANVFTGDFVISRKEVTITGTAAETTRVYNGSTTAEITDKGTLNGVCDGDKLDIVAGNADYADKNVGKDKTVTFTGFTLDGADKDNYALKAQPASVTADITVREVTITGAAVAAERFYNGSTTAEIANIGTPDGKCDGDKLDIVAGNAAYADKKVGKDKTVTFTGFTLDGADKDNYVLKEQPASTTADITPRELTVENLKIKAKQYDGTDKAEIDGTPTLGGVVDGDTLTLISGTPAFSSTAAGESVAVTFTSPFALEGDEVTLANYTLVQPTGITASIAAWITDGSEYSVNASDWINSDFTVTAKTGYQIGLTDTVDGDWTDKLTASDETGNGVLTFYVKNANGVISSAVSRHYRIDKTAPAGTITINGGTSFQKFLDTISFGQVFKGDVTVKLTAADEASGVKTVAYYKSDRALSLEEVRAVTDWKQGDSFGIAARDKEQFVIYVCITDNAGNVTYISSDGAKFDIPAPESTGGESGNTGSGSSTEAGANAGNGSGSSTEAGANAGNGSGSSTGAGANAGNGSGSSAGAGANAGNGSGSSTGTGEVMPYIKGENGKEGWEVIRLQLEESGADETVTVVMNGTTVVPKGILDSMKGEDVTIVLDIGDGISWKINGRDIEGAAGDIDLGVTMGAQAGKSIPAEVINNLTGERSSMKLTLSYDGEFGFTARLSVNMEVKNAGLYANLFYYNEQTGELEFISAGQIGEDGSAELAFTHASDYMIILDTVVMNGSAEDGTESADDMESTESTEAGNVPAPVPEDAGDQFPWNYVIMIIAGICIVMIVCGAVWYVSKKKDSEE